MNKKGQIEILLLLCCVAGVVAYLSFAMGALNLASKVDEKQPEVSVLIKDQDRLLAEKKRIEEEVTRLERIIDELRKKVEQRAKEPTVKKQPDKELERKKLEEELKKLKEEYEKLLKMIREKEEELSRIRTEALTIAEK
jgi:chromosome segregation ATPase